MRRRGLFRVGASEPDLPFGQANLLSQRNVGTANKRFSGAAFSQDKTILYTSDQSFPAVNYNIVDINDTSTWTLRSTRSIATDLRGMGVNNSGTKIYITGGAGSIRQSVLATPHDLSVETLGVTFNTGLGGTFGGSNLSPDEMKMFASFYYASPTLTKIAEIQLQSPGDLTGAQLIRTVDVPTMQRGCAFSPNGDYFMTAYAAEGYIHTVSPPYSLQNIQTQQITGTFESQGQVAIDHVNSRLYSVAWIDRLRIHEMIF